MLHHFAILFYLLCVVCQDFESEVEPCSRDGVPGRCVSIYKCLSTVKDIEDRNNPPICSFEGKTPIICCTDCELVRDTRLYLFNPVLGILNKTGTNKAADNYSCKNFLPQLKYVTQLEPDKNCTIKVGTRRHTGIGFSAGGRNAFRKEYPHMALLGYGDDIDTASWLCGGSVISERFILTAAHCLYSPSVGSVKYIALGILQRSDPSQLWQRYYVKNAIGHPDYKPPSKYNDIALLETDKRISFSSAVLPACLHTDDKFDSYAFATGWGALGHRKELADILQSVGLHQFSKQECLEFYPPHRHLLNGYDDASQMCYGDKKDTEIPTDTCEGDSGGPLQSEDHQMCVFTILGVTSFGRQCGQSGATGIYTRVSHYVPWIESIVWP